MFYLKFLASDLLTIRTVFGLKKTALMITVIFIENVL